MCCIFFHLPILQLSRYLFVFYINCLKNPEQCRTTFQAYGTIYDLQLPSQGLGRSLEVCSDWQKWCAGVVHVYDTAISPLSGSPDLDLCSVRAYSMCLYRISLIESLRGCGGHTLFCAFSSSLGTWSVLCMYLPSLWGACSHHSLLSWITNQTQEHNFKISVAGFQLSHSSQLHPPLVVWS